MGEAAAAAARTAENVAAAASAAACEEAAAVAAAGKAEKAAAELIMEEEQDQAAKLRKQEAKHRKKIRASSKKAQLQTKVLGRNPVLAEQTAEECTHSSGRSRNSSICPHLLHHCGVRLKHIYIALTNASPLLTLQAVLPVPTRLLVCNPL